MDSDPAQAELAYARGGPPQASAELRQTPQDFVVNEQLHIDHSGEGEHLWIEAQKCGWTTPQLASQLARHFEVAVRDVGYSGMKDRHAVTRQWFSLPTSASGDNLPALEGIDWLQTQRHSRKLKRGTHNGNAFVLTLNAVSGEQQLIEDDLNRLLKQGFPNYFGQQRFAQGRNLDAARRLFGGARLKRTARSMALSAVRSQVFNTLLSQRVANQTWNRLLPGEAVMLDASHSVFVLPEAAAERAEVAERLAQFDVHPSGPLPGTGASVCTGEAAEMEAAVLAQYPEFVDGLHRFNVKQARRALRVRPTGLAWEWLDHTRLRLSFGLPTGVFATALLRECLHTTEPSQEFKRG